MGSGAWGGFRRTEETPNSFLLPFRCLGVGSRSRQPETASIRWLRVSATCPWFPLASVWTQCFSRTRCPCCARSIAAWRSFRSGQRSPQPCSHRAPHLLRAGERVHQLLPGDNWRPNQGSQLAKRQIALGQSQR